MSWLGTGMKCDVLSKHIFHQYSKYIYTFLGTDGNLFSNRYSINTPFLDTDSKNVVFFKQLFHQYPKYIYKCLGPDRFVNNTPSLSTHSVVQVILTILTNKFEIINTCTAYCKNVSKMFYPTSYFTNTPRTPIHSLVQMVQMVECFSPKQLFHQYSNYIYTFVDTDRFVNNNPRFPTHTLVQIVLDNTDKQL